MRAVGGDHVACANGGGLAGIAMLDVRRDARVILLEGRHLRGETQIGAEFFRALLEKRLQQALGNEHALAGTQVADTFIEVRDVVGDFFAGQRFHAHDRAILDELLGRPPAHDLFHAHRSEDFHGALGDLRGARMDGGSAMMLHHQRAHAVVAEQHRARHADQAATDDEDGDFDRIRQE